MIPRPSVFLQLGHIGSALSLSFEDVGVDEDDAGTAFVSNVNFTGTNPLRLSSNRH